jgi:bifunctional non-homologous end joining protein LigD
LVCPPLGSAIDVVNAKSSAGKLRQYRAKRDFHRTPEPAPEESEPSASKASSKRASKASGERVSGKRASKASSARFVVHEHHARRLHWDLRLERDGALMSWAVPNGIPQDPSENRKAIHVEDHPLSYIDFQGEIPEGNYGAGRVLIWDRGTYDCEKFSDGKLVIVFHGKRLRGRYALFRTHTEKDWMIHRMDPPSEEREAMPERLSPMLAVSGALPASSDAWGFEVKWDGVRAIAYWRPGRLRLESRNLNDVSSRYPELRALGRQLGAREAILDGEIVAFGEDGTPSFERLQSRMHLTSDGAIRRLARETPATYVIFDLLYLDGRSTMGLAYHERRALLEGLSLDGPAWRTPTYQQGNGRDLLEVTAKHGLEGVLAKRLDAVYRPGERNSHWVKVKNINRQELLIGGWLAGKGRRSGQLGALLMGYYEDEGEDESEGKGKGKGNGKGGKGEGHGGKGHEGKGRSLRYAGRVGTGFDEPELERLAKQLAARRRRSSPFSKRGVQPPREAHFVEPELVAEIEFSHWTRQRILRHSSYKGLRCDKPAVEVKIETPLLAPYEVLRETKRYTEIGVEGRTLRLSNRDKVLYPDSGFTKGDMVDYYAAVAPVLLPHLQGRPLTFKRYPDGVHEPYFYEKRCPSHRPEWVQTAAIWSERQEEPIDYCVVGDLPTLIWTANLASIELHPSLSRASRMDTPTMLVFDLDPGPPAGLRECCRVALWIKELFEAFALTTLVKTSGSKGLQVYLPLNVPIGYEQTKPFARAVAELLQKQHPRVVLSRMTKSHRPGKVFIDWSQNDPHKTTVCVYSLRARERPMISTPLTWEEVEQGSRRRKEQQLSAEPAVLLERVEQHGDLFEPLLSLTQTLPDLFSEGARRVSRRAKR